MEYIRIISPAVPSYMRPLLKGSRVGTSESSKLFTHTNCGYCDLSRPNHTANNPVHSASRSAAGGWGAVGFAQGDAVQ
jgi:hypothetical protein